MTTWKCD